MSSLQRELYWKSLVELETWLVNTAGAVSTSGGNEVPYLLLAAQLLDDFEGGDGTEMTHKHWRDLVQLHCTFVMVST